MRKIYATTAQLISDMNSGEKGSSFDGLSERLKEASKAIQGKFGPFIPVKEIRTFTVDYRIHEDQALAISPLLEVNSVKVNGVEIRNYALQPSQRRWPNGPYTMISREHGFHSEDVVEIDGLWGKYEELMEIDLTVSQETETKKTMIVSNGGLISPGMVLLIDDEQEFITCVMVPRGASATLLTSKLNGEIDDVNSSQIIEIDDGSEVFEDEVIRVESEDLLIERVSGNSLTVQRGWNQTLITQSRR